jgi:hypothetical protein
MDRREQARAGLRGRRSDGRRQEADDQGQAVADDEAATERDGLATTG